MTDKPILFSAPMVRAILDGRKTMTRRALKPQPWVEGPFILVQNKKGPKGAGWILNNAPEMVLSELPYHAGDTLWVREAWRTNAMWDHLKPSDLGTESQKHGRVSLHYEAGGSAPNSCDPKDAGRLRPGMFMPRWASRITLRVTAVKIERLQDISDDDAKAEGIFYQPPTDEDLDWYKSYCEENGLDPTVPMDGVWQSGDPGKHMWGPTPQFAFRHLWESINGPGAWEANPWVAAYAFERVK